MLVDWLEEVNDNDQDEIDVGVVRGQMFVQLKSSAIAIIVIESVCCKCKIVYDMAYLQTKTSV